MTAPPCPSLAGAAGDIDAEPTSRLALLTALEKKVLWLSTWIVHYANHLRPNPGGLKVGGHQASSASLVTLMTALYFDVLRPADRVAVKPHASPVFHAIQYLLGHQSRENLERFRMLGGAQAYPSRTKDADDVDFSTGSVGLGVAMTAFASLARDYLKLRDLIPGDLGEGRMVALVGDAELDEGNVHEALLEGWKHDLRNLWWVIDYNRQSLDTVVTDRLFSRIDDVFRNFGWRVVTLKYGRRLEAAFARPGGAALREWIDACPNSLYSALVYKGGAAWREHLSRDLGGVDGIGAVLDRDDDDLSALMTNLAGHDMETVLSAFRAVDDDRPTCFIAYTIKGFGLPLAGHKDNHPGVMTEAQMAGFKEAMGIPDGAEWNKFAGLDVPAEALQQALEAVPFNRSGRRRYRAAAVPVPAVLPHSKERRMSTQEGFGRILVDLARGGVPLTERIVTASPDVTLTTNLSGWVNQRGVFDRRPSGDVFREEKVVSAQLWEMSPTGQHVELGIAENNLFILMAAMGLAHSLFGARLLPIGVLYDPFIQRGLDALNYACYQDARFLLVATPSGISLAPEGGAHQSIGTPLIGIAQDGIAAFEPAFVDELAAIMAWAFDYMQRDGSGRSETGWLRDVEGGAVYLRLSTCALDQPERTLGDSLRRDILAGGYWMVPPAPGAELAIVYQGVVASQALAAHAAIIEDIPGAGLLAVTSADRLHAGWSAAQAARQRGEVGADQLSHVERVLAPLSDQAALVTVIDGHPATLAWLGSVGGHHVQALGVEHFGQSGDLRELYRHYRIDADAIIDAAAATCVQRLRR